MENLYGWNVCLPWQGDPAKLWMTRQTLELLTPDRWMDYFCTEPVEWPGYVPTVRSWHLDGIIAPGVRERLYDHPNGETWIFLNEGHVAGQDDVTPARARDLALKFINLAREMDVDMNWCGPNASINFPSQHAGGFSGQAWWREFLRLLRLAGIGSPSMHGVHLYHSTDRAMLQSAWQMLRRDWLWQWIGKGKPVIITEVCAEDQPYEYQAAVMGECYRLYQTGREQGPAGDEGAMGVFWYAGYDYGLWQNSALCEVDPGKSETMRLTALGRHWKSLQARLA